MIHITVIIATFNAEHVLPKTLSALQLQSYPKEKMEVLIVDGGSTDKTRAIAKSYGAKIINNPHTEPVYAKFLGYNHAKGKYIMYLDADEVLENKDSLSLKKGTLEDNPKVKAIACSGYKNPYKYSFINNYINEFGDPFSFFIYRLSKDANLFIPTMKKRYNTIKETKACIIFDFSHTKSLPIIELCAGGSMFDGEFMKKNFPETLKSPDLIPHFFYLLYSTAPFLAISKQDALVHYSSDTYRKYLKKILWRIKNNIYHVSEMGSAGFSGRQEFLSSWDKLKKFLFIPYSFSLILPFFDALYLSITRKKLLYFIHIPLTIYTAYEIVQHTILKRMGVQMQLKSYGESKVISNL